MQKNIFHQGRENQFQKLENTFYFVCTINFAGKAKRNWEMQILVEQRVHKDTKSRMLCQISPREGAKGSFHPITTNSCFSNEQSCSLAFSEHSKLMHLSARREAR